MSNPIRTARAILFAALFAMLVIGCQAQKEKAAAAPQPAQAATRPAARAPVDTRPAVVSPRALAVSKPVPVNQVEDAAVWMHPDDPEKSLLIISNKTRGLEVHRPDGLLLKHYDDGTEFNGVDVIYEVPQDGQTVDLVITACQTAQSAGVTVWRVDPDKGKLRPATADSIISVFEHDSPLGVCTFHSRKSGKCYFFVTSAAGQIEQYELMPVSGEQFTAKRVRQFSRPGKVKAGVVDEERGIVYFAEEKVGVWSYPAEPDAAPEPTLVIRVGEQGLIPDLTGLALYCGRGGQGYLIVVSQGAKGTESHFQVYQRQAPHAFALSIQPSAEGYNAPQRSSGIVVTNGRISSQFPAGFLALKDRSNPNGVEDYKIYSWKDIAQPGGLLIDTEWSPRPSKSAQPLSNSVAQPAGGKSPKAGE